ncbi:hypothetical protein RIMD111065_40840 [Aeromonas hydrophila]|nr:hypothetical protein RIMD111065_40840 [Aeromonas hydrophila]
MRPIANRLNTRFIVYLPQIELIADLDLIGLLVLEPLSKLTGRGAAPISPLNCSVMLGVSQIELIADLI